MLDCNSGKNIDTQDCQRLGLLLLIGKPSAALLSIAVEIMTAPIHNMVNDCIKISAPYDVVTGTSCPRRH